MALRGIILLEGADSSGKSTLARYLVEKHGARYLHSTVRREIWRFHVGALRRAVRLAHEQLVVLDRHWLSELVYGRVFRGGSAYDVGARCLDRVLRRHGALTVLCVPADARAQEERWRRERDAGKHEHFDRVREVISLYAELAHGNLAYPGGGYLDQLVRFQDFTARDDVVVYDLDAYRGPRGIAAFARQALQQLEYLQRHVVPVRGDNLVGRVSHRGCLLVGEGPSPWCDRNPHVPRWPWCDRDDHLSAATWLNRAVHHLALREDRLAFTNVEGDFSYLPELLWHHEGSRVVALGNVAYRRIRDLGGTAEMVVHPSHHRRFNHADGPEGYARLLREAMGR